MTEDNSDRQPTFVRIGLIPFRLLLASGNPHRTIDRLLTSRHVRDLQAIMAAALFVFSVILLGCFLLSLEGTSGSWLWQTCPKCGPVLLVLAVARKFVSNFVLYSGPVVTLFLAVLAWVYQSGSARLGVVDLFACEMSTLCRISTIFDTVRRRVVAFDQPVPEAPPGSHSDGQAQAFTSQENYFPVFDGCVRDLQTLEAQVVINITAFYTYMKAIRDSLRQMAETGGADQSRQREFARNVLFLLFLAMESARRATRDLVEFQPEYAERTVTILISELEAWGFLCLQFSDENDIRHKRLVLRRPEYQKLVPELCREIERSSERDAEWRPAAELLSELRERYRRAMGHSIHSAV